MKNFNTQTKFEDSIFFRPVVICAAFCLLIVFSLGFFTKFYAIGDTAENQAYINQNQLEENIPTTEINNTEVNVPSFRATSIGNDGYPYIDDFSATEEGFKITVDVIDPLATYQWQVSSNKEFSHPIQLAQTKTMDVSSPQNGYWYRCIVNGITVSKPVQAIYYDEASEGYNGKWYLGNGTVFGSSFISNWWSWNFKAYDIIGYYTPEGQNEPILVCNTYAQYGYFMFTSNEAFPDPIRVCDIIDDYICDISDVMISFNESNPNTINVELVFPNTVKSVGSYSDTDLCYGVEEFDDCLLEARLKSNKELYQIQNVGTDGSEFDDNMSSFVAKFMTPVSRFYIDKYDEDFICKMYDYHYDTSGEECYITSDVKAPDKPNLFHNVVTGLNGLDSTYVLSWMNLQTTSLKNVYSIGRVDETGVIKMSALPKSSTSIEVENDPNYYFALYDTNGTPVVNYQKYTIPTINFNSLNPDTPYQVRRKLDIAQEEFTSQNIRTYINPKYNKQEVDNEVVVNATGDSIILTNAEPTYKYGLKDSEGSMVQDFTAPIGGRVSFEGLNELSNYTIFCISDLNLNSEQLEVATGKALHAQATSCTQIVVENMDGYEIALMDANDNIVGDFGWKTYSESQIIFNGLIPDTPYFVKAKNSSNECLKSVLTFIDPTVTVTGTPIEFTVTSNSLKLTVAEPLYSYALLDTSGNQVTPYLAPVEDGSVLFENLQGGLQYFLIAISDDNFNSEQLGLALWTDYSVVANSSSKITVSNNASFKYALYNAEDNSLISDWQNYTDEEIVYEGLKPNTKYIVKESPENNGISLCRAIRTFVDPSRKINLDTINIEILDSGVHLSNAENQYEYALFDDNMEPIQDYAFPVDGNLNFDNLEKGSLVILVARHVLNSQSDLVKIVLQESFNANIYGTKGLKTFDWEYTDGTTSLTGSDREFYNQNLYANTEILFTENQAYSVYTTSHGYSVIRSFSAVPYDRYSFSYWSVNGTAMVNGQKIIVDQDLDIVAVMKHDAVMLSIPFTECVDAYNWTFNDNGQVSSGSLPQVDFNDLWVNGNLSFNGSTINFEYNNPETADVASGQIDVIINDEWSFENFEINGATAIDGNSYLVNPGENVSLLVNAVYSPHGPAGTRDVANLTLIIFAIFALGTALSLALFFRKLIK